MPLESYWLRCISVVSFRFKTSRGSFLYLLRSVLGATHVLLPLFPNPLAIPARIVLTVALSLVILPLLLAQSLASKRVVYATGLSLVTYVAWLGFVTYAHIHGTLHANSGLFRLGIFWEGISMFFFFFDLFRFPMANLFSNHSYNCLCIHLLFHSPIVCITEGDNSAYYHC